MTPGDKESNFEKLWIGTKFASLVVDIIVQLDLPSELRSALQIPFEVGFSNSIQSLGFLNSIQILGFLNSIQILE